MPTSDLVLLSEARRAAKDGTAAKLRRCANLSQGEFAQALGVRQGTISRWEGGTRQPTGSAAIRYARLLRLLEEQTPA